jgi:seryl-tRNA synthetase
MEPERNVIPMPLNEVAFPQPVPAPIQAVPAPIQAVPAPIQAVPALEAPAPEGGSVDKIRDILFGSQMRDYDKRFARLEERLIKEASDLRDENRRRFDGLESFIRSELSALSDRVKNDAYRRDELNEAMSLHLQETARNMERKLSQLDEQTSHAQRDLRQQLLSQSNELNEEIRRKHDELAAAFTREADELRHDKTDRAALADLFTELALRLNNQFHLPGE